MRKDDKTKSAARNDDKMTVLNGVFRVFSSFRVGISTFRVADFAWRYFVFTSFRMALFRFFVFSRGVISRRKDEMAQSSHPKKKKKNGCKQEFQASFSLLFEYWRC